MHHAEADALAGDLGPFLADVLAVLVVHRAEELVECRPVTRVLPLELHVSRSSQSSPNSASSAAAWKLIWADDTASHRQCIAQRRQQRGAL